MDGKNARALAGNGDVTAMQSSLATILSDLDALKTEHAFKQKFESVFASFGFSRYAYVGIDATEIDEDRDKPLAGVYLTNLPNDWVMHYLKEDYANIDPVIKDCATTRLPITWTEKYRANARSKNEGLVMEDAWENGMKRGMTIPIHGPGRELGIFTLNADMNEREFREISERTKYELQSIAYFFHDPVQRALKTEPESVPLPVALTQREVEILRWTVAGKTAWEIGAILKISERTVNFHVQNVMEKFGVHNKTHAAAKAMGLGFLNV